MKTITLTDEQYDLLTDALFFTERHVQDYESNDETFGNLVDGINDLSQVVGDQV